MVLDLDRVKSDLSERRWIVKLISGQDLLKGILWDPNHFWAEYRQAKDQRKLGY